MKTIAINGENFKVMEKYHNPYQHISFKKLLSCYKKPSFAKHQIYGYWRNFFDKINTKESCHGILTYNINMFTYGGYAYINGLEWFLYITKTRQEAYLVDRLYNL